MAVEVGEWDSNDNASTGRALPMHKASRFVPTEHRVPLDEAKTLMQVEGYEHKDEVRPTNIVIEYPLAVDAGVEHDWGSWYIPHYDAIDVQSSLHSNFSTMQGKCHFDRLKASVNAGASFVLLIGAEQCQ